MDSEKHVSWPLIIRFRYHPVFVLCRFRPVESNKATAVSAILLYTTQNPWWWVALVACIAIGCGLVRSWPGKTSVAVWVVLLVTGVIPAGLFGLFAIMLSKVKQAAQ